MMTFNPQSYDKYDVLGDYHWQPLRTAFSHQFMAMRLAAIREFLAATEPADKRQWVVLDVGCGDGRILYEIGALGAWALGIDLSLTGLSHARRHIPEAYLVAADARALPLPNEFCHAVVCADLIEHLVTPELLLHEIHRVLQPGGSLILSTPNRLSLAKLVRGARWREVVSDKRHFREFSLGELARMLRDQGFTLGALRGLGLSFPLRRFALTSSRLARLSLRLGDIVPALADQLIVGARRENDVDRG